MGMGRITQNTNLSGMQGKGGAARPAQQPAAGMGAKGVGQLPAQQPNLNNALSGLAGAPVQAYPFPQPPATYQTFQDAMQNGPVAGMGGKGVGGQLSSQAGALNEAMMGFNQPPVQVQPTPVQPVPVQPVAGMGGKGAVQQLANRASQ